MSIPGFQSMDALTELQYERNEAQHPVPNCWERLFIENQSKMVKTVEVFVFFVKCLYYSDKDCGEKIDDRFFPKNSICTAGPF